jgi:hypothetical protein
MTNSDPNKMQTGGLSEAVRQESDKQIMGWIQATSENNRVVTDRKLNNHYSGQSGNAKELAGRAAVEFGMSYSMRDKDSREGTSVAWWWNNSEDLKSTKSAVPSPITDHPIQDGIARDSDHFQ